jgi:hypothetical protein
MRDTHHVDFAHRGAVERATQPGQQANDGGIGVAFDSVEGFNHGELTAPLLKLLKNGRQVGDLDDVIKKKKASATAKNTTRP